MKWTTVFLFLPIYINTEFIPLFIYIFLYVRSSFAVDGAKMKVNKEVERVLQDFHNAKKPIG